MGNQTWRPIETAPKNGKEVLLYGVWFGEISGEYEGSSAAVGLFSHGIWLLAHADTYGVECEPTHWMPLPEAPHD